MGDLHAPVAGFGRAEFGHLVIVLHLLLGDETVVFSPPPINKSTPSSSSSMRLGSLSAGIVSVCFVKLRFSSACAPAVPKWSDGCNTAARRLLVGVMGWFVPQVLGSVMAIQPGFECQMALGLMLLLVPLQAHRHPHPATEQAMRAASSAPPLHWSHDGDGARAAWLTPAAGLYRQSVGAYALWKWEWRRGLVRVPLTSVDHDLRDDAHYSIIVALMISTSSAFTSQAGLAA